MIREHLTRLFKRVCPSCVDGKDTEKHIDWLQTQAVAARRETETTREKRASLSQQRRAPLGDPLLPRRVPRRTDPPHPVNPVKKGGW